MRARADEMVELPGGAMKLASLDRLVHALDAEAVRYLAAFTALARLGYRPLVPIPAAQFADPALRAVAVRFVSIPSLIRMKEAAGRPQDRIDIEYLRKLADGSR
ncbi:MAG: hypothetical protein ACT4P3_05765 [Betaproteobacteria bacterium]